MKKLLSILVLAAAFVAIAPADATAADQTPTINRQSKQNFVGPQRPDKEKMKKQFEERLQLTDKQKEKAKKIHEKGRTQMAPVMGKIKAKRQEMMQVQQSTTLSAEEKAKQIEQLKTDVKALDKQAKELRKQNSEEFEKILNKTQKAELEKMKAEGRAKFEKHHKARPPFQGLGSPSMFFPPKDNDK